MARPADLERSDMRTSVVAVLSASLVLPAAAGLAGEPAIPGGISISFASLDSSGGMAGSGRSDAVVNLGLVSAWPTPPGAVRKSVTTVVVRRVSVRVDGPSELRFVRLSARLADDDPRCRVHVDGVRLSSALQLLDASVRLGTAAAHTIRIEVPHAEPPGPFLNAIEWLAETE
jgi:hypothetical protein